MTLPEWQRELAGLILAGSDPEPALPGSPAHAPGSPTRMSPEERASLERARGSSGLRLTKLVQRWWRVFRTRASLPLTMACLGDAGDSLMDEFVEVDREPSSFFLGEALGFLSFLSDRDMSRPHLAAVMEFERSMLILTQAAATGALHLPTGPPPVDRPLRRHPGAAAITFWSPPAELFAALLSGRPAPRPGSDPHVLIVAAHLPQLCRAGTDLERRMFEQWGNSGRLAGLPGDQDQHGAALAALWEAGAIIEE